jgi:hypothetical protein
LKLGAGFEHYRKGDIKLRAIERDQLVRKIQEWRIKAGKEVDPFDRYLSLFIAYNIFYNLYKKTQDPGANLFHGDSTRAVEARSLADRAILFKTLEPELKGYVRFIPIYGEEFWDGGVPIRKTLAEALNDENSDKTVEMLLKWLYKVRCNIVHGEKNYDDFQQRKLLEQSSSLLEKVLAHLMDSYNRKYVAGPEKGIFSE